MVSSAREIAVRRDRTPAHAPVRLLSTRNSSLERARDLTGRGRMARRHETARLRRSRRKSGLRDEEIGIAQLRTSVARQPSYTSLHERIASVSETDANTPSHSVAGSPPRSLDTVRAKSEISLANRATHAR